MKARTTAPTEVPRASDPASDHAYARLQVVRRSRKFLEDRHSLTAAERAQARQIVATDPLIRRLLEDARGYSVGLVGPVTPNNPRLLVGAHTRVRFDHAVSGRYRLPTGCYDLAGRWIPLPPLGIVLTDVREIEVQVGFDNGRVINVSPLNGRERLAPGVKLPMPPPPCAKADRANPGH